MVGRRGRGDGSPRAVVRVVVPLLLAVAGVVVLVVASGVGRVSPPPAPAPSPPVEGQGVRPAPPPAPPQQPSPTPVEDTDDRVSGPLLPQSEPVGLRIPAIDVRSRVVPLGLDAAGAMEVPADPADVGWYTGAPTPGALGPAVLAGHVTWDRVPAVFFRLAGLERGDRIHVTRRDGLTAVFEVREVTVVAKSRFPTRRVYGATDHAALRLITCAGRYDVDRARYADNAVVSAALVAVRRPAVSRPGR